MMNFCNVLKSLSSGVLLLASASCVFAQLRYDPKTGNYVNSSGQTTTEILGGTGTQNANPITTAVPFLNISPDSRAGAMGDAGAATSPDIYSAHWNPAKYVFMEKDYGIAVSWTPWLRKLVDDMNIYYIPGYVRLRKEDAIHFSFTYFNLGKIDFTDQSGNQYYQFNPREFAFSTGYSRLLSDQLSVSVSLKYIYSNLAGNFASSDGSTQSKPANSVAGDVGVYWNKEYTLGTMNTKFSWGAFISNVGSKVAYTNNNVKDFIPANLKVGVAYTLELDLYNKLTFTVDANKLLVPTPPIYIISANGTDSVDANGDKVIYKGKDPNRGLLAGTFGSFTDAPGGAAEEFREIMWSFGAEYWYSDIFALRAGHFRESALKGNRKYFTFGFGLKFYEGAAGIDFSYLVSGQQNNPLEGTLRFSLYTLLAKKSEKQTESITE
jgi:hypothetical protein